MANNVTGFGTVINLIGSVTFPAGVMVTQFSDDADPLDMASVKIADTAMGVNGDLIAWAKAVTLPMVLNVIPGSVDDVNLQTLFDANRVAQGKASANDVITATIVYPDKSTAILGLGVITDGQPSKSIAGSGRLKTKSYAFSFQTKT